MVREGCTEEGEGGKRGGKREREEVEREGRKGR